MIFEILKSYQEMYIYVYPIDSEILYHIFTNASYKKYGPDGNSSGILYRYQHLISFGLNDIILYTDDKGNYKNIFADVAVITNKSEFSKIVEPVESTISTPSRATTCGCDRKRGRTGRYWPPSAKGRR